MKKILLLGGSAQQVIAITKAKKLGFYTILCDYLPDNPGQYEADKFYLESTTDKEAILKIAQMERVDGILAYASDPAAPTAAYVATKMNLPTNLYDSVNILCNKDLFRIFLFKHGFAVPNVYKNYDSIKRYPVIVKPVDSSGSKGVTIVHKKSLLKKAINEALKFSRSKRIIIEDFIQKEHNYLIGGDIFVVDGKIKIWGLLNCHRDNSGNSLVPVGKSYPLDLTDKQIAIAKSTLKKLVSELKINFGPMNIEMVMDKSDNCYLIDAGPRAGGNMIPELLSIIFNVDIVEALIKLSLGETIDVNPDLKECFYASYNLHSIKQGVYKRIDFDNIIEPFIIKKSLYKKDGDIVDSFDNASKALGIIFMRFQNAEQQSILKEIDKHINIILK